MPITANPSEIDILVVDDERNIVEIVSDFLSAEGYNVHQAYDGEEALEKVNSDTNLVILDIMMPGMDGFEVCEKLRSRVETEMIPIIFLSAKSEVEDQIEGLTIGADDYLTKESGWKDLLVARVKAVLRRSGVEESSVIEEGDLTIYEDEYKAHLHGEDLELTLTEFELLRYLVRHPKKAFTRQQLLETIWKDHMMVTERTVDAHIKNLREKLGDFAEHIQTVRGVGYRFIKEVSAEA
ncbi:MAG: response regulator transcription factor [Longimonas sp.]|uniref:response regulator transcription factor n=1 Tax=Longimonas sp. TaxID=2039626 RepID=UPI003974AE91